MKQKTVTKETASSLASKIREISISEFFSKNRHLLGFDSPLKALLTAVREGVDNALDACEEAGILPELEIDIEKEEENRFKVSITDNGPGIIKSQLANIFGKLLYGSKFHRLRQSRGQQGIGISAAVLYSQMTTGKPAEIISKIGKGKPAHFIKLQIETHKNNPKILSESEEKSAYWKQKDSGISIRLTLEGAYKEGKQGILSYIHQTALANAHARIRFTDPKRKVHNFPRLLHELPPAPKEIKPHPHGVELGSLIQLLHDGKKTSLAKFFTQAFSRVTDKLAEEVCKKAKINPNQPVSQLNRSQIESFYTAIQETSLLPPPTNCLAGLGQEGLLKALYWLFVASKEWNEQEIDQQEIDQQEIDQQEIEEDKERLQPSLFGGAKNSKADRAPSGIVLPQEQTMLLESQEEAFFSKGEEFFGTAVSRSPAVYRGNPFLVEVGLFYGKGLKMDAPVQIYRYANRVPLQYQASACAITKAVLSIPWKTYGLEQSKGASPVGPMVIMVHIASVWVPYTSESKEAVAHYPEILKEFRLALLECGRRLQRFLRKQRQKADEAKKRSYLEKYIDPIGEALGEILQLPKSNQEKIVQQIKSILEKSRGKKTPSHS